MWKLVALVCATGCASEARLPASYFAESGTVLQQGHVAVTGVAGGGATLDGAGAGAGGRVRLGVGDGNEVGIEAGGMLLDSPEDQCFIDCGSNYTQERFTTRQLSALLSWKYQLRPELAVVLGVGGSSHGTHAMSTGGEDGRGRSFDAAAGAVRSMRLGADSEIYVGARFTLAVPTSRDQGEHASKVLGLSSAFGVDYKLSPHLHGFVEGGPRGTVIFREGPTFGLSAVAGLGLVL